MKSLLTTIFLAFANSLPLSALPVTNYRDTPHQTVLSESLPNLPKCEDQLLQINTVNLSPNAQYAISLSLEFSAPKKYKLR